MAFVCLFTQGPRNGTGPQGPTDKPKNTKLWWLAWWLDVGKAQMYTSPFLLLLFPFSRCQSSEHFLLSQPALMVNTPTILSSHFKPSFPQPLWLLIEAADALFSLIVPQLLPVRPSTAPIMSLVSWETLRLKCQRCSYSHRHSITRYPWLISFFLYIVCFLFKNTNIRKDIRKLILI